MRETSSYFIGREVRRAVPHFRKVVARGVWTGMDVVYYGNGRTVEYDVVVQPGADLRPLGEMSRVIHQPEHTLEKMSKVVQQIHTRKFGLGFFVALDLARSVLLPVTISTSRM